MNQKSCPNEQIWQIIDLENLPDGRHRLAEYAHSCQGIGSFATLADWVADDLLEDYECVYVAVCREEIIGFVALLKEFVCLDDEREPWLDFLFVDEAKRKRGIGTALIERVINRAAELSFEYLYIGTQSHKEYYVKNGFSEIERVYEYNGSKNEIPMYLMRRQVSL